MALEDLTLKRYAKLGATFLEGGKEDYVAAGICLEKLAEDENCPDEMKYLLNGSLAHEQGIKVALSGAFEEYMKAYKEASVEDFWEIYKNDGYSDGEKRIYSAKLSPLKNMKPENIEKVLKDKKKEFKDISTNKKAPESTIIDLNREINIYEEAMGILQNLEQYNHISLMEPVQKELIKKQKEQIKYNLRRIVGIN